MADTPKPTGENLETEEDSFFEISGSLKEDEQKRLQGLLASLNFDDPEGSKKLLRDAMGNPNVSDELKAEISNKIKMIDEAECKLEVGLGSAPTASPDPTPDPARVLPPVDPAYDEALAKHCGSLPDSNGKYITTETSGKSCVTFPGGRKVEFDQAGNMTCYGKILTTGPRIGADAAKFTVMRLAEQARLDPSGRTDAIHLNGKLGVKEADLVQFYAAAQAEPLETAMLKLKQAQEGTPEYAAALKDLKDQLEGHGPYKPMNIVHNGKVFQPSNKVIRGLTSVRDSDAAGSAVFHTKSENGLAYVDKVVESSRNAALGMLKEYNEKYEAKAKTAPSPSGTSTPTPVAPVEPAPAAKEPVVVPEPVEKVSSDNKQETPTNGVTHVNGEALVTDSTVEGKGNDGNGGMAGGEDVIKAEEASPDKKQEAQANGVTHVNGEKIVTDSVVEGKGNDGNGGIAGGEHEDDHNDGLAAAIVKEEAKANGGVSLEKKPKDVSASEKVNSNDVLKKPETPNPIIAKSTGNLMKGPSR